MTERISINSKSLQAAFPEVYQEFFAKCDLVISANRQITWTGDYGVIYGGIMLRESLPIRTYVGISFRGRSNKIKIGSCLEFDPSKRVFLSADPETYYKNKLEHHLSEFLEKTVNIQSKGFEIHILNELSFNRGVGQRGAFFSPLIIGILLLHEKISQIEISKWRNLDSCSLKEPINKFDLVFRLAWKLDNFISAAACGNNVFGALFPSVGPFVFLSKLPKEIYLEAGRGLSLDSLSLLDRGEYWGARLSELISQGEGHPWPFDYGLIHIGEVGNSRSSYLWAVDRIKNIKADAVNFEKQLNQYFNFSSNIIQPAVYALATDSDNLWFNYVNILLINQLQTFLCFRDIFKSNLLPSLADKLIEYLQREQHLFYNFNLSSLSTDKICSAIQSLFQEKEAANPFVVVKMVGSRRQGHVMFFINSDQMKNKVNEVVSTVNMKFNTSAVLDYVSWLDGYAEEGGIKIEQHLAGNIHSPLVSSDILKLDLYTKGNIVNKMVKLDKLNKKEVDLLLDTIHNKIYINGKSVHADQIPTQTATIEILRKLLAQLDKDVSNKELPGQSYSSYRNEFQGKISSPLMKLMGDKIKIDVKGELLNFTVRLEISRGTRIGVLKMV